MGYLIVAIFLIAMIFSGDVLLFFLGIGIIYLIGKAVYNAEDTENYTYHKDSSGKKVRTLKPDRHLFNCPSCNKQRSKYSDLCPTCGDVYKHTNHNQPYRT